MWTKPIGGVQLEDLALNYLSMPTTDTPRAQSTSSGVAEDDIAFSLSLCREVHRIYGMYQDGDLSTGCDTWAALRVTLEMLSVLQNTVVDGLPSRRLEIATAQLNEIDQVLFKGGPDIGTQDGPQPRSRALAVPGDDNSWGSVPSQSAPEGRSFSRRAESGPPASFEMDPIRRVWGRLCSLWQARSLPVRVALGLAGCLLLAVLIDVPFTLMALFPSMVIPVTAGCIGVPLAVGGLYRLRYPQPEERVPAQRAA
jgi:hypothetical protein